MRHETDGYVGDPKPTSKSDDATGNNLAGISESSSLSSGTAPGDKNTVRSKLTIKREGQVVPRESVLEIITRAFYIHIELEEVGPQLWVSQTPKLVCAYHQGGRCHCRSQVLGTNR